MLQAPLSEAPWGPPRGPLEAFVARAATAKGAELLRVIGEALLHPDVFVFGELLVLDNVLELAHPGDSQGSDEGSGVRALKLLRLMASGTVGDLVELIKLKEANPVPPVLLFKLRLLTIASRAAVSSRLFFKDLQEALEAPGCCGSVEGAGLFESVFEVPHESPASQGCNGICASQETAAKTAKAALDAEEIEELVLESLRLGLVKGRVDGELGCLYTWDAISRDPTDRDIRAMISVLSDFDVRLSKTVQHFRDAAEALERHAII